MFNCVENEIIMKEYYTYDYKPVNASAQIIKIEELSIHFGKGYEETEKYYVHKLW